MKTKQCIWCLQNLPLESFAFKNKELKKRQTHCRVCHSNYRKQRYQQQRQKECKRIQDRKHEIRNWFYEYKSYCSCIRCGENHIATLHFHHSNPANKFMEVSKMMHEGYSKESILNEIAKCEVLCANCHAKLHWEDSR